jgi:hypothetical protein
VEHVLLFTKQLKHGETQREQFPLIGLRVYPTAQAPQKLFPTQDKQFEGEHVKQLDTLLVIVKTNPGWHTVQLLLN